VGEGGRGDEGQKARECNKPRIAPKNATRENTPVRRAFPARRAPGSTGVSPACPPLQGEVFREAPACHLPFPGIRTPNLPLLPVWEKGGGGMLTGVDFLASPCVPIFRFRHQDAQPPPSPRVGEGGRGDEGQKARECNKPRIAPKNATRENTPVRRAFPARRAPGSTGVSPACPSLQGEVFGEASAYHLPFPGIRTPNLPLLPVWEKGGGGMLTGVDFLASPCVPSSVSRHQDAQPPPSPRVGEGGRGDEGQKARECSKPRIAPKNATRENTPVRRAFPARHTPGSTGVSPACPPLQGEVFREAPACHLPFQASGRPTSPFSPCGRRGQGG
jgi:ribosomal protein L15